MYPLLSEFEQENYTANNAICNFGDKNCNNIHK